MTLIGTDSYAAALVAAFTKVEATIFKFALIALALLVLMIVALFAAMWLERRDRRKTAALTADVQARIDGGALR